MADDPKSSTGFDIAALGHHLRKQTEGSSEREAYLEKLRKLVQSGEYKIDSEALARKLLEEAERDADPGHCGEDEAK